METSSMLCITAVRWYIPFILRPYDLQCAWTRRSRMACVGRRKISITSDSLVFHRSHADKKRNGASVLERWRDIPSVMPKQVGCGKAVRIAQSAGPRGYLPAGLGFRLSATELGNSQDIVSRLHQHACSSAAFQMPTLASISICCRWITSAAPSWHSHSATRCWDVPSIGE